MSENFDTLLLLAMPASGKSEVRTFLTKKDPQAFHMGETVQLDDYPYVHLQLLADEALVKLGQPRAFHQQDPEGQRNGPFMDPHELGGLCELLNDDYQELRQGRAENPADPARRLLERFDSASERAGGKAKFRHLDSKVLDSLVAELDAEARKFYAEKLEAFPPSLEGKTVVIEFARGGPDSGSMPLAKGYGYAGSLPYLAPELLERACVLYIWVSPEESRRKNRARARPDGHGSILFHGTPESVMTREYGACDMQHLIETSGTPDALRVERDGKSFSVPVAVFDNREDLTTFARKPEAEWTEAEIGAIRGGLKEACDRLWTSSQKLQGA